MLEIEIKLAIGPVEPFVRRLEGRGAVLAHPRSLEDNVLLDLDEGSLRARGAALRVRTYAGQALLTYKEPAPGPEGFKVRREMETTVPDGGLCLQILQRAGLRKAWRYMKYRTIYRVADIDLSVMIDETPIGNFAELEGAQESIDAFALRIGNSPADYILLSYRSLLEQWCQGRGVQVGDMLFEAEQPS